VVKSLRGFACNRWPWFIRKNFDFFQNLKTPLPAGPFWRLAHFFAFSPKQLWVWDRTLFWQRDMPSDWWLIGGCQRIR
jgi:hypothetical protein